jgi:hypothetical protein
LESSSRKYNLKNQANCGDAGMCPSWANHWLATS